MILFLPEKEDLKKVMNALCSFKGRMIECAIALIIFVINLILVLIDKSYSDTIMHTIMVCTGWFILVFNWICTYLYAKKIYGRSIDYLENLEKDFEKDEDDYHSSWQKQLGETYKKHKNDNA